MTVLVVDASVAVKWFVPEEGSAQALALIDDGLRLIAPELLVAEVANVAWKKQRRRELSGREAYDMLALLAQIEIALVSIIPLAQAALAIARDSDRSLYDCLYVALAIRDQATLVTADRRFRDALGAGDLAHHVVLLDELDVRP